MYVCVYEGGVWYSLLLPCLRFPITLNGSNYFVNNTGGGVTLLNTQMDAYGTIVMDDNTAAFGGGLAMDDRCLVRTYLCTVLGGGAGGDDRCLDDRFLVCNNCIYV